MRVTILVLVSSWLSAVTAAQADVAGQRLEAAAAAFAAKQVEDAAEALLEAWLAIDAVTDDPLKSSLSAKALEIGSAATPEFADRLKLERDIVARIEPVILQLLEARRPSTASRIASAMPPLVARRYATRIEEIERTIDEKEKQRDHALILAFTAALIHGDASNLGLLLKEFPALDEWLIHRRELAPAAERLAASHHRLKWYRTARRLAIVAIDLGPTATHFAPSDRLVDTCDAALAEERYRIHARPHMDAFRRNCTTQGESRNWEFNGPVWKTPWRGHRALVLSGDPIAGDCSIEVELGIPKSGGTIQIVVAWLDGADQQEYCAAEVGTWGGGLPLIRLVHVKGKASRILAEFMMQVVRRWDFENLQASVEANRVSVNFMWKTITADLPFERGDRATKFGFCVPEQTIKVDGKRRDKDDVFSIRNLVVRRS